MSDSSTPKVLAIDDDPSALHLIDSCLEDLDIELLTAGSCKEAVEVLKKNRDLSIIITDYELPDANGVALIKALRTHGLTVPIICLSGHSDRNIIVQAAKLKIESWMVKPYKPEELIDTVEKILLVS